MTEPDAGWLQQLNTYVSLFGDAFRRRDQARWAAVYLQGLLRSDGRKTTNHLARRVLLPADLTVEDAAQALQNFINQSPWDEQAIGRRFRTLMAERFAEPDGVFVLGDLTFVKQGRHSVGVQRQYSTALGRKTNCQVAVALHSVGAAGCCPLSMRLYLPRTWLQHPQQLDAVGVPPEFRGAGGKGAIALDLLEEARRDGWSGRWVLGGAGFGGDRHFRASLSAGGFMYLLDAPADWELDEGESLYTAEDGRVRVTNQAPGAEAPPWRARRAWEAVAEAELHLLNGLGLDHFEGRSWRGFHHHACLVMLAFGFHLLHGSHGDYSSVEAAAVGV